jgi:hypothetical protein
MEQNFYGDKSFEFEFKSELKRTPCKKSKCFVVANAKQSQLLARYPLQNAAMYGVKF